MNPNQSQENDQFNGNYPQPQPQPQMQAPIYNNPQSTPLQPQQQLTGQPPKSNKKIIVLISAIIGTLLIIGGAILTYFMLAPVSKADYKRAADTVSGLTSTFDTLVDGNRDLTSEKEEDREKALESIKSEFTEFNKKLNGLASEKAVKKDKEAAGLYKVVMDKKPHQDELFYVTIEALEYVSPLLITATSDPGAIPAAASELKSNISKIKASVNKKYAEDMLRLFEGYAENAVKIADMKSGKGKYDMRVIEEVQKFNKDLSEVSEVWGDHVKELTDKASGINDDLDALHKHLNSKANE